jgi:tetratricopeptide (TPR) repeat protein
VRWVVVAVVAGVLAVSAAAGVPSGATAAATESPEVTALCTRAATLRAAGEEADAVAAYKRALETSPTSACATKGLRDGPPATLATVLDDIVQLLPQILLAAGLVLLALFAVLLLGHIRWMHRKLVRIWGLGRMLSPRMTLSPLTDQSGLSVGGTLDARIKRQLAESRRLASMQKGPAYEMDFSTPAEDFADLIAGDSGLKSALEKASESSDQLKIVAAVLTLMYTLLPTQRLVVSGIVEPVTGPCASATLNLEEGGRPVAAATLRGSPPDGGAALAAVDFVDLAEPAAVWVQYEVARAIRGDIDRGPGAAVSYALVREGLANQRDGDAQSARSKFEQARELDGRNWSASLNLAMTEARLAKDYRRAVEILDVAFREIQHR